MPGVRLDQGVPGADRQRTGQRAVFGQILLDDVALVAQRDRESVETGRSVVLHDVPEDRLSTDLDHGLGLEFGLLAQSAAYTSRENCDPDVRIILSARALCLLHGSVPFRVRLP